MNNYRIIASPNDQSLATRDTTQRRFQFPQIAVPRTYYGQPVFEGAGNSQGSGITFARSRSNSFAVTIETPQCQIMCDFHAWAQSKNQPRNQCVTQKWGQPLPVRGPWIHRSDQNQTADTFWRQGRGHHRYCPAMGRSQQNT